MKSRKRLEYYSNKLKKLKSREKKIDFTSSNYGFVPSYIFQDRSVAVLEAIVEYLKEVKGLTYHEIALLINRNDRTVWTCYNRAKKKRPSPSYKETDNFVPIPLEIIKDRTVAVLENIVEHLKEIKELTYHEIAVLINRDDRTVWTCYNRAKKKRANLKEQILQNNKKDFQNNSRSDSKMPGGDKK